MPRRTRASGRFASTARVSAWNMSPRFASSVMDLSAAA